MREDREIANLVRRRDSLTGRRTGLGKSSLIKGKKKKLRLRLRIVEDIQIVPPRSGGGSIRSDKGPDSQSEGWTVVGDRRKKPAVMPRVPP